ncbi:MAG: carboxypeptidase regulatory-like domain-containing protein, partial [Verrucomicrobia bacterium]|nr:carboxypeptidase regulatory-like domain-containing protein [Verrucomicrobiota bacterium]
SGTVSATGGAGTIAGGAGTIYSKAGSAMTGRLVIDNGGLIGTNTPLSSLFSLPISPFDLILNGGAAVLPMTPLPLLSNLTVGAGCLLTMMAGETNIAVTVLRDVNLAAGSVLAADGKGFSRNTGTGRGNSTSNKGSGGGYGGLGGASSSGAVGGTNYGAASQPVDRGSGGGTGLGSSPLGGDGGGAIKLIVGGTLSLDDARLGANGSEGLQDDSGGGSGGSVWITASAITGSGIINADGGAGELFNGGGGGGGRIAIYSPANTFTGLVSVAGGAGWVAGGTGTVFQSSSLIPFAAISHSPSTPVSNVVSFVDVSFNAPVNPFTVDTGDVVLQVPPGAAAVTNFTVSTLSPTMLRVSFASQSAPGNYSLLLGPAITDVLGQPMSQVYTGGFSIVLPTVSGTVTNAAGQPMAGVQLVPSSTLSPGVSDEDGNYAVGFIPGLTFTVTPSLPGFIFVPGTRNYTNLTDAVTNENFLAVTSITPSLTNQLSGSNLFVRWGGISGVNYQPQYSTNLVDWLPYGGVVPGTNGTMELQIPISTDPMEFFRVKASN